jgi:hypothetical protein
VGEIEKCVAGILMAPMGTTKPPVALLSKVQNEVALVYRRLGGMLDVPPQRAGKFDSKWGPIMVEVDECRHFNRYREITLDSPLYDAMPRFPREAYRRFCREYEYECWKAANWGGYWTDKNECCERQFGAGQPQGTPLDAFEGIGPNPNGAPRWKQRAFYDFLKDVCSALGPPDMVRVAEWDPLDGPCGPLLVGDLRKHGPCSPRIHMHRP